MYLVMARFRRASHHAAQWMVHVKWNMTVFGDVIPNLRHGPLQSGQHWCNVDGPREVDHDGFSHAPRKTANVNYSSSAPS